MLYLCWLMFSGAWQQTMINKGTTSAVMELPWPGSIRAAWCSRRWPRLILAHEFWKLVTGRLAEDELIAVIESEERRSRAAAGPAAASVAAAARK